LDGGLAQRKASAYTEGGGHTHTHTHASISPVGLEPTMSEFEGSKTRNLEVGDGYRTAGNKFRGDSVSYSHVC